MKERKNEKQIEKIKPKKFLTPVMIAAIVILALVVIILIGISSNHSTKIVGTNTLPQEQVKEKKISVTEVPTSVVNGTETSVAIEMQNLIMSFMPWIIASAILVLIRVAQNLFNDYV